MKRLAAVVLALVAFASGACTDPNEDADELRSFVRTSERQPRTFTYQVASESQAYRVRASIEDELRHAMVLSYGGREVMDYVVRDDAIAVRLRDTEFGSRLANVLGDPVVDAALREGRWVIDPAGAPPLIGSDVVAGREVSGDPFRDARDAIRFVGQAIGSARDVKEFTLEDIEYRSALDPWRYPPEEGDEVRYDLIRPFLPTSEAQTVGGSGDIGAPQFRKTSIFVDGRHIEQVCSVVDVEGHEEFIELRRRGLDSNPFLAQLLERIQEGETALPIEERYWVAEVDYPEDVSVDAPPDAETGKLETFLTAFQSALEAGLLRPTESVDTSACRRTTSES